MATEGGERDSSTAPLSTGTEGPGSLAWPGAAQVSSCRPQARPASLVWMTKAASLQLPTAAISPTLNLATQTEASSSPKLLTKQESLLLQEHPAPQHPCSCQLSGPRPAGLTWGLGERCCDKPLRDAVVAAHLPIRDQLGWTSTCPCNPAWLQRSQALSVLEQLPAGYSEPQSIP